MARFEGKCPSCGKTLYSNREDDIVVCDCWRYCRVCGAEMVPYAPDLACNTYGIDGKRDFAVLMICVQHSPPFYSTQKPVEVVCK